MSREITFKQVLDSEGNFKHLELIQGNNVIEIALGNSFAYGNHTYVWEVLKRTIDSISDEVNERTKRADT